MKLSKLNYILVFLICLAPSRLLAISTTGTATAIIATPITINEDTNLSFGKFALGTGGTGGTITLTPALATVKTVSGLNALSVPVVTAGKFTVTGVSGAAFAITMPSTITLNGPGTAMTVDNITSFPSGGAILNGGTQTLYIGGRLNVNAAQANGSYTGVYTVAVAYQ